LTQGGWLGPQSGPVANHSEIVAFNPSTAGFCTYLVPGNDNEVTGMAVTGTGRRAVVWFIESDPVGGHPAIDSFSPGQVGESCPNNYVLSGAPSFRQIAWPHDDFPAQIAVDPGGAVMWVTDFFGSAVEEVHIATGTVTTLSYGSKNGYSAYGAEPWEVVADNSYVYAIDYGDSNLVRINKTNGQIDQVPIPLTSDTEQGFGLAISGNNLYFSLSDDAQPAFGAASTIGYVDIATWEAASAACPTSVDCAPLPGTGVVYTGLSAVADPLSDSDFRGIAMSATGSMAIADLHQVLRLTP
jgi:DNA-binding beta-propeller fold protein YncE